MAPLLLPGYDVVGAVGDVPGAWRARRQADGRTVLLRVPNDAVPPDGVDRLVDLRRGLARVGALSADSLLPLHTVITTDEGPVVVYDYPAGGPLRSLLVARGRLTVGEVVTLGSGLADALAQVHQAGLSHGGLSEESVYLGLDGTPLLADVGLGGGRPEQDLPALVVLCRRALGDVRRAGPGPAAGVLAVLAATEKRSGIDAAGFGSALRAAAPAVPIRLTSAVPPAGEAPARPTLDGVPGDSGEVEDADVAADHPRAADAPDVGPPGSRRLLRNGLPSSGAASRRTRFRREDRAQRGRAPARRSNRATVLSAIAVVLALLAAVGLGVQWARVSGSHPSAALPPRPGPAAATPARTATRSPSPNIAARSPSSPVTGPTTSASTRRSISRPPTPSATPVPGVSWLAVVQKLDERRAAAFAAADAAALVAVDAPSSPALRVDQQAAAELRRRGAHARGLRWEVVRVAVDSTGPPGVVLRVTDRMSAHELVGSDGTVLASRPARAQTEWRVTLLPAAGGWRFSQTAAV